eukprot:scaffold72962_cov18-Tisochrysis_lutea.AAC.1
MLLDLGCGSGLSGEELSDMGHVWVGTDISPAMLDVALERELLCPLAKNVLPTQLCEEPNSLCLSLSLLNDNQDCKAAPPACKQCYGASTVTLGIGRGLPCAGRPGPWPASAAVTLLAVPKKEMPGICCDPFGIDGGRPCAAHPQSWPARAASKVRVLTATWLRVTLRCMTSATDCPSALAPLMGPSPSAQCNGCATRIRGATSQGEHHNAEAAWT